MVVVRDQSTEQDSAWASWNQLMNPLASTPVSIIEFTEEWLKLKLYPAQRIILKVYNGEELDEWELDIVKLWIQKGHLPPGILNRIQEGEPFRRIIMAVGRRGSKSTLSAVIALYETYRLLLKPNPQEFYTIQEGERIQIACVADSTNQADETIFSKIHSFLPKCKWLMDRLPLGTELKPGRDIFFQTDADRNEIEQVYLDTGKRPWKASIQLRVYSALSGRIRGRSIIVIVMDEMAHYQNREGRDNAHNISEAAVPSIMEFGPDGRVIAISSPKYESGKFFEMWSDTWQGEAKNTIAFQVPTWAIYEHGEMRNMMVKFTFDQLKEDDETIRFGTPAWWREYGAQFQKSVSLYMNPDHVERAFKLSEELNWTWQDAGRHVFFYHVHGDPAKNGAAFPLLVAHYDETYDKVFVDWGWRWRVAKSQIDLAGPREKVYPQGSVIYYPDVEEAGRNILDRFFVRAFTFDHWNSIGSIQELERHAAKTGIEFVNIDEATFTGPFQYRIYEKLRTGLANEQVVCPRWQPLQQELNNVEDQGGKISSPSQGPCTTKDVADCLAVVFERCMQEAAQGVRNRNMSGDSIEALGSDIFNLPSGALVGEGSVERDWSANWPGT